MIYSKIRGLVGGAYNGVLHTPPPPAAMLKLQGDAHLRTVAQIKFLYYPPDSVDPLTYSRPAYPVYVYLLPQVSI